MSNSTIFILNSYGSLQPIGIPGELCTGGGGVARGYLNNPELTSEKFDQDLWDKKDDQDKCGALRGNFHHSSFISHNSKLYHTGDLCRWLPDGNIEFLGRIDNQIKIRGYRIEMQEIENCLLKIKKVKEAIIIDRVDRNGSRYLCAYVVIEEDSQLSSLRDLLEKVLPDYMIPTYFVTMKMIPLTTNGKIDRKSLPDPDVVGNAGNTHEKYVAPGGKIENKLVEIWSDVLSKSPHGIGINTNFFQLGGHSLKATVMVSKIHKEFNVHLPLAEIFKNPTIRGLSHYIKKSVKEKYESIKLTEKKEYCLLSSAQKRLFMLNQMDQQSVGYNMPSFSVLEGKLDKDRFKNTFNQLINRHESLRTSFHMINEEPVQRIHDKVEFAIEYLITNKNEHTQTLLKNFIRPFDLAKAPLLRLALLKENEDRYILMIDMHHIISDGTSMNIAVKDFMALYQEENLPKLRVQYKDFSEWQNNEKQKESIQKQERFWLKELAGEIPVLELPIDHVRPAIQSFEGSRIPFEIDKNTTEDLKKLTVETNVTLYMLLLSVYSVFLSKITNQEDIIIGSPIAGRRHADLEKIIGMFVNTLALRNFPSGEKTFWEFLYEVKEKILNAFENQDYQYEDLVTQVVINRDASRNPLFDTMFALQNIDISEINIPGLNLSPYQHENKVSKFDLSLSGMERKDKLFFIFEYSTKLFKKETIERFIVYFKNVINGVIIDKNRKISDTEIITEEEKKQVLFDFNDTEAEYPKDKIIQQIFVEQASKTPDYIALIGAESEAKKRRREEEKNDGVETLCATSLQIQISYRQLDQQSDRLAGLLIEKGMHSDNIVGIMLERSIEMIIGILGILKSCGAYLPIDPEYPQERISYIMKDSGTKLLIVTNNQEGKEMRKWEGEKNFEIVYLNSFSSSSFPTLYLSNFLTSYPFSLAYIIYTSGTTGSPKGVAVMHGGVVNYIYWRLAAYGFTEKDVTLQLLSYTFDGFGVNLYSSLLSGGKLLMVPCSKLLDFDYTARMISRYWVTNTSLTPGIYGALLESIHHRQLESLRFVVLAGEQSSGSLVEKSREKIPQAKLCNEYGPTETTICVTSNMELSVSATGIIGKPIANTGIYIIDQSEHVVPVGIPGQLVISGRGLARGYVNSSELTCEKFRPLITQMMQTTLMKNKSFFGDKDGQNLVYRTGDLGRWLTDGNIEYLGRIDQQVKIRGFRIELEEIENRLAKHPVIKEAVVLDQTGEDGDKYLCAYIVGNIENMVAELREFLGRA
ncbi:MAG: amino acid adenylation domain-containing protein, partial [Acidobacteria bacterium]|nr:amino acid adenylation domain-containing protein [Acidobacteriota bacterium]